MLRIRRSLAANPGHSASTFAFSVLLDPAEETPGAGPGHHLCQSSWALAANLGHSASTFAFSVLLDPALRSAKGTPTAASAYPETSIPMDRAVPASIFTAESIFEVLRSGIFTSAISSS